MFLEDVDFDGDPKRADAKRKALAELVRENAMVEMNAALQLTD